MAIREIVKNKEYQIIVVLGYSGNKRVRHYETYYGGKKEATLRENELKLQLKKNTFAIKDNITLRQLFNEWLEFKKPTIAPKTYSSYKLYSDNTCKTLGHIKLKNLNAQILDKFYNDLLLNNVPTKTIKHYREVIGNALKTAVKWDYISNNPNEKATTIKVIQKEMSFYSQKDVDKLLEVLDNEPIKRQALIKLAIDSGCRRSEITGLKWENVDFEKRTIEIKQITQYDSKLGIYEKEPKTESSKRTIVLCNDTINCLKKLKQEEALHQLQLGKAWGKSKRVFVTDMGKDMHPDTPSQILKSIIDKYNLKPVSFHGLRHSNATLLIEKGVNVQIISKRLGHSNIDITHKVYSHFIQEEFEAVADVMQDVFSNQKAN